MNRNFKLSRYGSIRYRALPWAKIVSQLAREGYTADGQMTGLLANALHERVLLPQLDEITTTQPADHWAILQANALRAVRTAAIHAAWVRFGRQIFELSPNLVSAFCLTDVTNSSFEGLHLPYRAFFLHFGLQNDFVLDDPGRSSPEYVDGAYIFQDAEGSIVIELTLARPREEASNLPGIQIVIDPDLAKLGADEAMSRAIDTELKGNEKPDTAQSANRGLNQEVRFQSATSLENARSVLIETASLISNALFYLSEPEEDVTIKVEEGASPDVANRALHGKPNQKQQAKQSLTAEGYAVVKYCGSLFPHPVADGEGLNEFTKSHWRRGHWRNQRHGLQLSNIKRIWIRPVLVKAEVGAPEMGRVYVVAPRNNS